MASTAKHNRPSKRRSVRKYHPDAYKFVFAALRYTQETLRRSLSDDPDDEAAHIDGRELLEGCRGLALEQYGLLARTVFESWGVRSTADFGHIVFDLVERDEMRKTETDRQSDFENVFDFAVALEQEYEIDPSRAFV